MSFDNHKNGPPNSNSGLNKKNFVDNNNVTMTSSTMNNNGPYDQLANNKDKEKNETSPNSNDFVDSDVTNDVQLANNPKGLNVQDKGKGKYASQDDDDDDD